MGPPSTDSFVLAGLYGGVSCNVPASPLLFPVRRLEPTDAGRCFLSLARAWASRCSGERQYCTVAPSSPLCRKNSDSGCAWSSLRVLRVARGQDAICAASTGYWFSSPWSSCELAFHLRGHSGTSYFRDALPSDLQGLSVLIAAFNALRGFVNWSPEFVNHPTFKPICGDWLFRKIRVAHGPDRFVRLGRGLELFVRDNFVPE